MCREHVGQGYSIKIKNTKQWNSTGNFSIWILECPEFHFHINTIGKQYSSCSRGFSRCISLRFRSELAYARHEYHPNSSSYWYNTWHVLPRPEWKRHLKHGPSQQNHSAINQQNLKSFHVPLQRSQRGRAIVSSRPDIPACCKIAVDIFRQMLGNTGCSRQTPVKNDI